MSTANLITASATGVRSMTGQGRASGKTDLGTLNIELRSVNNRGFKCSIRSPESLSGAESKIEAVVREYLHRGSINLSINLERDQGQTPLQINEAVLAGYIRQCQSAIRESIASQASAGPAETNPIPGVASPQPAAASLIVNVAALTSLPGVLSFDRVSDDTAGQVWQQVRLVLIDALENLVAMRQQEGLNMAETLLADCAVIQQHVRSIQTLAPQAAESYRARLEAKVNRVLADFDAQVGAVDLLREVQIYADRADVSEEITRLDSHLKLFQSVLLGENSDDLKSSVRDDAIGRKLDFIIQEMFRETNTIGSKSAHSDVSAIVVEIKCAIERMRELVQNLE
ncbi:MAG: YicC family protein [Planctomycetales bacterium]|nr:YicC family protein [Planctomycetales bacterium]